MTKPKATDERPDDLKKNESTVENAVGWDAPQAAGTGLTATADGIRNTPPSSNSIPLPPPETKK